MVIHTATCQWCPGFDALCASENHKAKVEAAHNERWHGVPAPDTDEICDKVYNTHAAERDQVIACIEAVAKVNNGQIDPNAVRGLLPAGIKPQVVSATYNVLARQGRIERAGWTTNTDAAGRNQGKPLALWSMVKQKAATA